jgi:hypothetical protein
MKPGKVFGGNEKLLENTIKVYIDGTHPRRAGVLDNLSKDSENIIENTIV